VNAEIPAMIERATLMLDAQAGIAVLAVQDGTADRLIAGWGMTLTDARSCAAWVATQSDAVAIEALTVPAEHWPSSVAPLGGPNDGEVIVIPLDGDREALGWLALFGLPGALTRPPLSLPRMRAAFVGQLADQARALLEARRLRDERDRLASVFRFSGDGILTVDAMLRVTACNPALEQLIATSGAEMLGRFYYEVLRPETPQGEPLGLTHCPLLEAFATGAPVVDREIVIHARDGQAIPVAVTAAAVLSPEGVPVSGVLNVRDTSRDRTDEQLTSTFVSVVSHELQTPISIIKGYASMLGRPDVQWSGEALRQRLGAIEEEADRLSHMVANLLYASRIQAGGLTMQPGPLDLGDVVASCARRFSARGLRHDLRLHVPPNVPMVNADRERIEEVVANLLDNAAKYSPPGALIVVTVRFTSEEVIVSVSDSGTGIPLREQQRVFERFRRVEGDLTRSTSGAGLGLYICQAIVRAHGGQIWVESELGRGSTFAFSLLRIERAAVPMIVPNSKASRRKKKETAHA
jgi:signal transduction histidine kinase